MPIQFGMELKFKANSEHGDKKNESIENIDTLNQKKNPRFSFCPTLPSVII
jgi:hypothetical protein